ncbi:hypothetical protein ACFLUV_05970 [Elusimicrobiota bacterium]
MIKYSDTNKNKMIEKTLFYLMGIYLIILPLIDNLIFKVYGKIGWDNMLLLLMFIIYIFSIRSMKFNILMKRENRTYLLLIALFIAASLLPTINSIIYSPVINARAITNSMRFLKIIPLAIVLEASILSKMRFKQIIWCFFAGVLIAAIIGILQSMGVDSLWDIAARYYVKGEVEYYTFIRRIKVPAFFGQSGNTLGAYMAMGLILLLGVGEDVIKRHYRYLLVLIISMALFVSLSLTAIIAFLIVLIIFYALLLLKVISKRRRLIETVLLFSVAVLIVCSYNQRPIKERIAAKLKITGNNLFKVKGMTVRTKVWKEVIGDVGNDIRNGNKYLKLIFGRGYVFVPVTDNYYLELFLTGGILSILLFIILYFAIVFTEIKRIMNFKKDNTLSLMHIVPLSMLSGLAVMCFTGGYLGYSGVIIPIVISVIGAKNVLINNQYIEDKGV